MDEALTSLVAASITFVGTHFALSHPLRASLVKALARWALWAFIRLSRWPALAGWFLPSGLLAQADRLYGMADRKSVV